ncbi:kinase A anchor protein [Thelonectria olida]|uniref:Kinase A anchor protein n=1 Tax=Thelonectria olida TaxID=1576542 RepID=A0A9P8VTZ4_9HYPO|nr:kinase A anchor protein [Thelonectria olida]
MPPPTHFLCIPLVGAELVRNLASFKHEATSQWGFRVPPAAVRPPGTMHLTLGVMTLQEDGVQKATDLLQSLSLKDILAQTSNNAVESTLSISLKGLSAMQDAGSTSVLYAPPVDADGRLMRFCQAIKTSFTDAGLMAVENRPLLLHATVVNTVYVPQTRKRGRPREKIKLDARDMVEQYADFVWMEDMPVEKVTLCKMGARKIEGSDGDEAYEVVAEVRVGTETTGA